MNKTVYFIVALVCSVIPLRANTSAQNVLLDVLATKYIHARIVNISSGEVVRAHTVVTGNVERGYDIRDYYEHSGHYLDAEVLTSIRGISEQQSYYPGCDGRQYGEREEGFQSVCVYNNREEMGANKVDESGEVIQPGREISLSSNWAVTEVDGAKYIVHDHENFLVYSNETDQFVIGK